MNVQTSTIHSVRDGRSFKPIRMSAEDAAAPNVLAQLALVGINLDPRDLHGMAAWANDAAPDVQPLAYTATIGAPVQFLQTILPGWVTQVTQARKIDELIGVQTVGSWEDEEIVQGSLELTGLAQPYGDYTNIPLSSWNPSYERRTIVRFEEGMRVGALEAARSAKQRINSAATKRTAAALALDIVRNRVGFYGYNGGANRTYGLMNDPALPAYVVVPNGAAGTPGWNTKTFNEIVNDLLSTVELLRTQSGDTIDPSSDAITIVLPPSRMGYLGQISTFGNSVQDWVTKTYPNVRFKSALEFEAANGGANVMYAWADKAPDADSTDGGQTIVQMVPAKFKTVGTEVQAKALVEDYSNALAGVLVKRPYAVIRRTGI